MMSRISAVLVVLLVALYRGCTGEYLSHHGLEPGPNAIIPQQVPEELLSSLYDQPMSASSEKALLIELIQRALTGKVQQQEQLPRSEKLQQQQYEDKNIEEPSQALIDESGPFLSEQDKRGSYMSMCHFKICNMGRKRNLRRSQSMWNRM